ncbi:MAG: hypothetical protein C0402_05855 [Thermodesulfovibrio sp.]|nr:hypothetical protein [Thermodesulfovibrio sp.]
MRIKTRLRLNTIISLSTVILILLSLSLSFRAIFIADRDMDLVDEMRKVSFERILLRDEYFLYQEVRAKTQWQSKSEVLLNFFALADTRFDQEEDKALLQDARKDFNATFSQMSKVMESHAKQDTGLHKSPGFSEAELRLISQGILKAYSLTDNLNRLHESVQKKTIRAQNRGAFIVVLFILGGIIAIIINSTVIGRTLAKRITALGKGVEIMGAGNLDYRIAAEGDDELTTLAMASNEMAAKLKQSYTSVDNLQKEIAERMLVEEKLTISMADLQRSNKELEQFAYVASHDLQEPLRMVASYTQLLAERYENQLDDKARKFIHYAVDGAVRMQLLINDLLAYSRIGTKGKPLAPVSAHAVVGEAINNLKMKIDETKAIITNDELPEVRADASQLVQLFQNLIGNALKFRGAEDPRIHISARDEGREWLFMIRDNGIGIEPQYADKIFIIFQRLHTKEEYPGSGIGLAICKKIVERHGGRIWFDSEPGRGATFYFTIPK